MKIFVARHGETIWNKQNKVCGRTDVALTEEGVKQAKKLACQAQEHHIDVIFSSPLKRALETSEMVASLCETPLIVDNRLIEQDYGVFEGTDRKDHLFLEHKKNFAYRYPKGESMMQVAHRVYALLDEIKREYHGKHILIISHGGVCRILHTYFNDMTNEEFFHYTLENGTLVKYDL